MPELSPNELKRYSRHLLLPEVGAEGQKRLKAAKVIIIGAGGLGSPVSLYLAAAGVGTIGLVDFDRVDLSNLQRQILYSVNSIGQSKIESAGKRLSELNPEIDIRLHDSRLTAENARELIDKYDLVVDGTDNFATRYLVNDACVLLKKPNVYGSIFRFEGQASIFCLPGFPCYRCLFPVPPLPDTVPNCAEGGVLGVLAGFIGVVQATEAIKLILNQGTSLCGKLLVYDALEMRVDKLELKRDPKCPVCGDRPDITNIAESAASCETASAASAFSEISAGALAERIRDGLVEFILDVRNHEEFELGHLDRAIHIPLAELESRLSELDPNVEIILYCKSGGRSARAMELLRGHGFTRLKNLNGGILAWAKDVAPDMMAY